MEVSHAAQIVVVGVEAFGWLALRALDLGPLELRRDRADDGLGGLILATRNHRRARFRSARPTRCAPVIASMSCPVMRTLCAALRTLPSSTASRTPSSRPTCSASTARPL